MSAEPARGSVGVSSGTFTEGRRMGDTGATPGRDRDLLSAVEPRQYLDLLPQAVCVIDATRRLLARNARAETLFGRGGVMHLRAGRVEFTHPRLAADLDTHLAQLPVPRERSWFRVPRPSRGRDMIVRLEPNVALCAACDDKTPSFLVHLFLPTHRWSIPEPLLRAVYGLTPQETRVVGLLLEGCRMQEIADSLQASRETVRTHLKHVMHKLQVSTQLQLVQVLASGPWR